MTRVDLVGAWITDRLPMALRGRFTVGARELGLIAFVGALALCVAAGIALRSSAAAATPSHRGTSAATTSTPPLVAAHQGSVGSGVVVVDVSGSVVHPGVVRLPAGSRVYEALKAAGGARRGVDVSALNLARVMMDGEQIVVGVKTTVAPGGGASAGSPSVVSINRATESDLDALPGIGPVTAKNIIDWREAHGGFTRIEELEEVTGIGPKTFAKLKSLIGL